MCRGGLVITKFDTHGRGKKLYWFEKKDRFEKDLLFGDGGNDIIVNIAGTKGEVSKELDEVISYLKSGEVEGDYTRELDDAVAAVKKSDERKREYMRIIRYEDELRRDERLRTRAEDVINLMETMGLDADTLIANMKIDEYDREKIKELAAEKLQMVPA